ncbi:MAG TPA: hypothetical protein PLQ94_06975, partial [Anaerolineales bacterium]|nr:hypothetical protein [Anaerolineales bacterium]
VDGKPGAHYAMVEDTCVGCHMGEAGNHRFAPEVGACVACHADAESIDINGAITAFEAKVVELHDALVAKGLMNDDGTNVLKNGDAPVQLDPPQAAALFVYHLIEEDGSKSAHNPNYFNALVDASLEALK